MSNGRKFGAKLPFLPNFVSGPLDCGTGCPLVICGWGQIGRAVTHAMVSERPYDTHVIDQSDAAVKVARAQGLHAVMGNAASVHSQRIARVGSATDIVICIDGTLNEEILRVARSLAPAAYIQMVVSSCAEPKILCELGADRVLVISNIAGTALAQWAMNL